MLTNVRAFSKLGPSDWLLVHKSSWRIEEDHLRIQVNGAEFRFPLTALI